MSERHVVLRVGRADRYAPKGVPRTRVVLTLDGKGDNPETDIMHKHLWRRLDELELKPPQVAIDLYRIAAAAFCADLRLPRREAYDGWTRQIVLHAPVADEGLWSTQLETLTKFLRFLSGDHWRVEVRNREVPPPKQKRRRTRDERAEEPEPFDRVCLFSGGLDSFIGAADEVADGMNVLLVSHVPEGIARWISPAQDVLRNGIAAGYKDRRIEHIKATLSPPRVTRHTGKEETQRVRSIYFIALGTLAAAAIGDSAPLFVPENGFISLNLPLTPGRIGSLSTRTTHPYAMILYRKLLVGLGIDVPVELPYMFLTKGEMLDGATDPELVQKLARKSVSCARPNPRSAEKEAHCGYCVPCIVRRAAMKRVDLDQAVDYRLDILNPGKELTAAEETHLNAFKLAMRRRRDGVGLPELLSAGPLPRAMGSVSDFKGLCDRGLAEVAAFIGDTA